LGLDGVGRRKEVKGRGGAAKVKDKGQAVRFAARLAEGGWRRRERRVMAVGFRRRQTHARQDVCVKAAS
jgi:hypothetical protein